jgi:dTDP-4-amino-4,6-dideoxygalactose transaminase
MRIPAYAGGKPIFDDLLMFGEPFIGEEEIEEMVNTLRSKWLGLGRKTQQFEKAFSAFVKCEEMIALNSCTAGLHIALKLLDLPPGSEALVPSMTFCSTANVVELCNYRPVFMDCDPITRCVGVKEIEARLSPSTRVVIVVHFAGYPCDMAQINSFCASKGLVVIEDCAHAIETHSEGKHVGNESAAGVYSFYATKNMTTGEGGMLHIRDPEKRALARQLSLHGMSKDAWKRYSDKGHQHYDIITPGFKYNMTDMQASLGIHQLKRIPENWVKRKKLWQAYTEAFKDLPLQLPADTSRDGDIHAYHLYSPLLQTDRVKISRDQLLDALIHENIGVGVHYKALHTSAYYSNKYGLKNDYCPISSDIGNRTFSLPFSPYLTGQQVESIILAVRSILLHASK